MHTLLALLNVNGEFVQYLCLYFLGDVRCTQMESATCGIRVNNNINKDMMPEATDDSFWLLHFHYLPVCHIRYKADLLDSRGLYSSPNSVSNHNSLPWAPVHGPLAIWKRMYWPTTGHEVPL